ncbi:U2(RNU2) small nuclear RNA auxiliary factor 1, partial [Fasciolopsis buskii]
VNCSFYFKIGACRHGEQCSRLHNKPSFGQVIRVAVLILVDYIAPKPVHSSSEHCSECRWIPYIVLKYFLSYFSVNLTEVQAQQIFDEFFEEVFVECEEKYGEIEEMNVCDNLGDHLVGNVYIKFRREEDAEKAVQDLNLRWFGGRPVHAELSPVTDFREACCRQYELGECTRGGFCNFMHLKPISRELCRKLYNRSKKRYGRKRRSRSRDRHRRSRSPRSSRR